MFDGTFIIYLYPYNGSTIYVQNAFFYFSIVMNFLLIN